MFSSSLSLAQESKSPEASQETIENQELRRQQLVIVRDTTLRKAIAGLKDMDEPGLRLSARILLAEYLWSGRLKPENKFLAEKIASDAITDYLAHKEEINVSTATALLSDLAALLEKHKPELADLLQPSADTDKLRDENNIQALLQQKGGDVSAARRILQMLRQGQEVSGISFYLKDLQKLNSGELQPLLEEIVALAESQKVSWETIFWSSDIYLQPETLQTLKRRFLAMIVQRTQPANFAATAPPRLAIELLARVMPVIENLLPELYNQALAQSIGLQASFSAEERAEQERNKRLAESATPVEDLLAEAAAAKTNAERNELFSSAALLALEKGKYELCLSALEQIDTEVRIKERPDLWRVWRDQTLAELVRKALAAKEADWAEKSARALASPATKVEALNLVVLYRLKMKQMPEAQKLLLEAIKVADTVPEPINQARVLLTLSVTCGQMDVAQRNAVMSNALKVLNKLSRPVVNPTNLDASYNQYVKGLNNIGYQLARVLKSYAQEDESNALALAEQLNKRDLRTFAYLGIMRGLDVVLTTKPEPQAQK